MPDFDAEISSFIDTHFDTGASDNGGNDNNVQPQQEQQPQQQSFQQQSDDDFASDIKAVQSEIKNKNEQGKQQGQQPQGQQPQQAEQAAKPQQLKPLRGGNFADEKGNIVDQNGRILARAGGEARLHQNLVQTRGQLEQSQARIRELENEVRTSQALNGLPQRMGLETADVTMALDLAAKVRQGKVVEVAREVLAMCVAQGHNVTDLLGSDVGDSIEMRALKQMLDQRLAPLTQQQQSQQAEQQTRQRAQTAYDAFVAQNEFAEYLADDIALVINAEGLNPQQAYNKLMAFVHRNNFDPTQPLQAQIEARRAQMAQQPQQQQQPQQRAQQQPKPMLNGARSAANASAATQQMFGADDDWASIIQQVQATV